MAVYFSGIALKVFMLAKHNTKVLLHPKERDACHRFRSIKCHAPIQRILATLFASIILAQFVCASSVVAMEDPPLQEQAQLQSLTNEISRLIEQQDYSHALDLAKQSLQLNQKAVGVEDSSNRKILNNVGWLLQQNGDLGAARKMFEQAIAISEAKRLKDQDLAWSMNNLATLLYVQGDFESSLPFYERALKIYEELGDDSKAERTLRNYAGVLDALDRGSDAVSAYRRALALAEKNRTDEFEIAQCLESLGSSLEDKLQYGECLPLFQRALEIKERLLGPDHIELASLLNNVAMLNLDTGHKEQAKKLLERALLISEKEKGQFHIDLVVLLNNLGDLQLLENNQRDAEPLYLRAARIVDTYFSDLLPFCSVAEQYAMYKAYNRDQLSRLLSVCDSPEKIKEVYEIVFSWKGTLLSSLAKQSEARRQAVTPELKANLEKLAKIRAELAAWYLEAGSMSLAEWKERNEHLTNSKEVLERAIVSAAPASKADGKLSLQNFQSILKDNEAVIDIYQYEKMLATQSGFTREMRYAALITCGGAGENTQKLVDLGSAKSVHAQLKKWRDEVLSMQNSDDSWKHLVAQLEKPFHALPAKTNKVWVCPDSELARLPWQLLARAIPQKDLLVSQIDSCHELVKIREKPRKTEIAAKSMLLVGNVDFNAGLDKNATQGVFHFPLLKGTAVEIASIAALAKADNIASVERTGQAASKAEVLKLLPESGYVHLATHGFFFNDSLLEMTRAMQAQHRSVQIRGRIESNLSRRNPLLESGLAFAGANKASNDKTLEKNGIITAEEFLDSDLSKCKLFVLSACDTGRGEELTGQGVMGLGASILAAGAENVLISLWRVPDAETAELMKELYSNIWRKRMVPAQALKQAQLDLCKRLPGGSRNTAFWGAWVLLGEGW